MIDTHNGNHFYDWLANHNLVSFSFLPVGSSARASKLLTKLTNVFPFLKRYTVIVVVVGGILTGHQDNAEFALDMCPTKPSYYLEVRYFKSVPSGG
ncbi:hypothetical protein C5167_020218 [Papaver somniferum]|uniref:Uncharacterized protein n=1 Tax=Papaver somniferum TaxID=3469 RepID=A0A4Y7IWA7_PAPSO|nr:hypothetical protein C5167_020218 [Papaver somniferum]